MVSRVAAHRLAIQLSRDNTNLDTLGVGLRSEALLLPVNIEGETVMTNDPVRVVKEWLKNHKAVAKASSTSPSRGRSLR
jgi:hypothetical protein